MQVSVRRDPDLSRTERPATVMPTVAEVLALDAFVPGEPAVVVGGAALDVPVRWVHASDSADVARLLQGGELLLSTGSGWPEDPGRIADFVRQLAEVGAAGIVLELGARYRAAPAALIDAARERGVALVVLHSEVRFVAITEAVHRRIIADQTAALEARDAVRTLFTGLALRGAPTEFIVEQAGLALAAPVVLETVSHDVVVAHVGGAIEASTLRGWARRSRAAAAAPDREGRAIVAVEARGTRWGWLVALPGAVHPAGREAVLEQAATALALGRLADPDGREWASLGRRRVVDALIDGRFTSLAAASARLDAAGMPLAATIAFPLVVLAPGGRDDAVEVGAAADVAAAAAGGRAVCGTSAALGDGSGRVRTAMIFAVPVRSAGGADAPGAAESRADEVAASLGAGARVRVAVGPGIPIGSGQSDGDGERGLGLLVAALRETIDLLGADEAGRPGPGRAPAVRVADRPLTRVVAAMRHDHRVVAHAERMLAPVLAATRTRGGDLLDVLAALLAHPTNRTAAAEAAHLSRSVFYQRIAVLEEMLGVDFDDGEQVAALHLAVLSHRLHGAG